MLKSRAMFEYEQNASVCQACDGRNDAVIQRSRCALQCRRCLSGRSCLAAALASQQVPAQVTLPPAAAAAAARRPGAVAAGHGRSLSPSCSRSPAKHRHHSDELDGTQ